MTRTWRLQNHTITSDHVAFVQERVADYLAHLQSVTWLNTIDDGISADVQRRLDERFGK